jgi:hypothetical protein
MKATMQKFRNKKRELSAENIQRAKRIKTWFLDAHGSFIQVMSKMKKLSDFMEMVEHNLLFNADEATICSDLEASIKNGKDLEQMQRRLQVFLRNFQVEAMGDSEIALTSYQEQKNEFASQLRAEVDEVSKEFEGFFTQMS